MCFLGGFRVRGCLAVWDLCCGSQVEAEGWTRWKAGVPPLCPQEPCLISQPPCVLKKMTAKQNALINYFPLFC